MLIGVNKNIEASVIMSVGPLMSSLGIWTQVNGFSDTNVGPVWQMPLLGSRRKVDDYWKDKEVIVVVWSLRRVR